MSEPEERGESPECAAPPGGPELEGVGEGEGEGNWFGLAMFRLPGASPLYGFVQSGKLSPCVPRTRSGPSISKQSWQDNLLIPILWPLG